MTTYRDSNSATPQWTPLPDADERFSSGIADFDRLLGGGFRRGSLVLFRVDETIGPAERELMLTPTLLNFLHHSNGILAVLPARESPKGFREHLTQWVGRRRFDTRVRVVDYVGEDLEAPYVVGLHGVPSATGTERRRREIGKNDMAVMVEAEKALRGARSHPFVEFVAFEIIETIAGPDIAARMFLHGIKRTRLVGNLGLGILRPGLQCSDAVRNMADMEFSLRRDEMGLILKGHRPAFPEHLVVPDPQRGEPYVALLPTP